MSIYQWIACWVAFGNILFEWTSAESLIFDWSVNLLNPFIVSVKISGEICLSFANVYFFSWCIGGDRGLNESVCSRVICVMLLIFRFCHNHIDCLSKFLFWQWYIWTIVIFNHSFQQIRIVFFFLGDHAHSFICHVNSVQKIPTTFEYVKIARYFICNWIFLILCLIICVLLFVYTFLKALWFVFLHRTLVDDDAFWFVLVRITDPR